MTDTQDALTAAEPAPVDVEDVGGVLAPADEPEGDDPDGYGAHPVPNESQRPIEDRLADAMAPPVAEGPDLDAYDEGHAAEHLEAWTVEDLDGAQWAARKLARAATKRAAVKKLRDDARARLDAWFDAETSDLDADARFFTGRLEGFHRAMFAADPKHAKTIKLPDGTILSSLAGKLAVEVPSMPELVKYAEANELTGDLLRYPDPEPNKVALAKYGSKAGAEPGEYRAFDVETGEEVPGVTIVRKERSYSISLPDDA